jgi:hypothetical protein
MAVGLIDAMPGWQESGCYKRANIHAISGSTLDWVNAVSFGLPQINMTLSFGFLPITKTNQPCKRTHS